MSAQKQYEAVIFVRLRSQQATEERLSHELATLVAGHREAVEVEVKVEPGRYVECVERWPGCMSGEHDPRCCRFPKSCSCSS